MGVTRDYRINKKDCFPQNVGYDGFAVASSRQTLVRQHCPTQDVGVGKWLSMKPCNKIYHRTLESAKHWLQILEVYITFIESLGYILDLLSVTEPSSGVAHRKYLLPLKNQNCG